MLSRLFPNWWKMHEILCDNSFRITSPLSTNLCYMSKIFWRTTVWNNSLESETRKNIKHYLCITSSTTSAELKLHQCIHSASSAGGSHHLYIKVCLCVCKFVDKNALKMDSVRQVLQSFIHSCIHKMYYNLNLGRLWTSKQSPNLILLHQAKQ